MLDIDPGQALQEAREWAHTPSQGLATTSEAAAGGAGWAFGSDGEVVYRMPSSADVAPIADLAEQSRHATELIAVASTDAAHLGILGMASVVGRRHNV